MSVHRVLGVAVVGLGVGEQHARAFAADPRVRLRSVADLDMARAEALAAELGTGVAPDYDRVIRDPSVDVVSIASYDDDHASQVEQAIQAGKHVFVEKPMCRTRDELRRIQRVWQRRPGHLQSNLVLRRAPLYQWLQQAVTAGELGRVYAFDGEYLFGRLHKITTGWRSGVTDYSVMLGGGVHLVDQMLDVSREPPVRVWSAGNGISTEGTAFRSADFHAATFEFPSGLVGRIAANFGCVHRHQHVVRVYGTRATFLSDDAGARLHERRDPTVPPRALDLSAEPLGKGVLVPSFVDAVLAGGDPTPAAHREFAVIQACLAADLALARATPQPVAGLAPVSPVEG